MANQENSSNVETMSASDLYDGITKRLTQVHGIVDLLGIVNADAESGLDTYSPAGVSWAAKDLLDQIRVYVERLEDIRKRDVGAKAAA